MAINRLPSFWDYLGEGITNFQEGRERREERALRQRQAKLSELSFLSNLYGSGAVGSETLRDQINQSGLGLPPVDIIPSAAERRQKILSRPDVEIPNPMGGIGGAIAPPIKIKGSDFATDDERAAAGLPSIAERTEANIKNRKTQIDMQTTERTTKDAQLSDAAGRFVPMALGKMGVAARRNPEAAAQVAFDEYKKMLASSKFGGLAPADEAYARAFFSKAVREAILEERKLEVQERIATNRASQQDLRFRQLVTLRESARKELDDMESNSRFGPIISMYKGQPLEQVPMSFRGLLQAHAERENYIRQIDQRLNELEPTGLNQPKATNIQIDPTVDARVEKMAADLKSGAITVKDLDEAVAAKVITKEQADAAKKKAQVVTTTAPRTTRKLRDTTAAWR